MNCFSLLGKGTSFTISRTDRLLPDPFRKDLVTAFIESFSYLSNTTSTRVQGFSILLVQELDRLRSYMSYAFLG